MLVNQAVLRMSFIVSCFKNTSGNLNFKYFRLELGIPTLRHFETA